MNDKLKGLSETALNNGLSDYYHRVMRGAELTARDHGLIHSVFLFAFGCGMEFAINELNRRTSDGNAKSRGSQD